MSHIELQTIRNRNMNQGQSGETPTDYQLHSGSSEEERVPLSPSRRAKKADIFRDESGVDDDASYEEREMSLQELLYSSSSFYAIVVPGK